MGFLRNMLLAVGSLAMAEAGLVAPFDAPWAVLPLLLLPYALASVAHALGTRGRWRRAAAASAAIGWSAPAVQIVAVTLCGWAAAVANLLGASAAFGAWPGPELLLALAPYVAAELLAIDARARALGLAADVRSDVCRLQARMLLSALVPIAALVLLSGAVGLHPGLHAWVDEVALVNGLFNALLLLVFALCLPRILTSAWRTAPIPAGWQRLVLEETARRAGFRCREVLLWDTSNTMANAAVVGFLPGHRVVLFSDALLAQLGPAELAAVFAHEIGHATRRHVWIFGAWALGVLMLADAGLRRFELESAGAELVVLGLVLLLGYLAFGFLSRRFELDADLESVATTGDLFGLVRALEQVGGAHAREKAGLRHFSVAQRVRFLLAHAANPEVGRKLRRRLRRWAIAGAVVFAAAVGVEAWSLARTLPSDRVVVELRLGRYSAAEDRASGLELDARLREAVEAARGLADEAPLTGLFDLARRRAVARDPAGALATLELAALRGAEVPPGVVAALQAHLRADPAGVRAALEEVDDPAWAAALARLAA